MKSRVEQVLEALDIEAILRGKQRWAKCPNRGHPDRNPSWRIRDEPGDERDGYHACPPCGFTGGIVGLISYVREVNYFEAHKLLEQIEKGVAIIPKPVPVSVEQTTRRHGFMIPPGVVVTSLDGWPPSAAKYAVKDRGLDFFQVVKWGIGYADEGRLAHRLVFITRDQKGVPRNYTARTYVDHPKRYFEPERWERADRNVMFGEELWGSQIGFDRPVIVVEGAIKGLAIDRARPDLAIAATAGSELMPGYLPKLLRFPKIVVATDANDAGDKIADELSFLLRKHQASHCRMRLRVDADEMPVIELRENLMRVL